jgi:hypothetical protein
MLPLTRWFASFVRVIPSENFAIAGNGDVVYLTTGLCSRAHLGWRGGVQTFHSEYGLGKSVVRFLGILYNRCPK